MIKHSEPMTVMGLSATIYCPDCGKPFDIRGHTILPTGEVQPSVIHGDCTFHAIVTLEGWGR
jgi:hypothetical protein